MVGVIGTIDPVPPGLQARQVVAVIRFASPSTVIFRGARQVSFRRYCLRVILVPGPFSLWVVSLALVIVSLDLALGLPGPCGQRVRFLAKAFLAVA